MSVFGHLLYGSAFRDDNAQRIRWPHRRGEYVVQTPAQRILSLDSPFQENVTLAREDLVK